MSDDPTEAALVARLEAAVALARTVIDDLDDTCDCGDHQQEIARYRERLAALTDACEAVGGVTAVNRLPCTGLTARWCPVHGDCICPRLDSRTLEEATCPLHGPSSTHAAPPPPKEAPMGWGERRTPTPDPIHYPRGGAEPPNAPPVPVTDHKPPPPPPRAAAQPALLRFETGVEWKDWPGFAFVRPDDVTSIRMADLTEHEPPPGVVATVTVLTRQGMFGRTFADVESAAAWATSVAEACGRVVTP